mmetsp:Transcript_23922/g.74129  ORF Transcript_23922/g.74129 Transcript_23922/m.74129 type:complete len:279 (+) Transcript_23922:77-913(+)
MVTCLSTAATVATSTQGTSDGGLLLAATGEPVLVAPASASRSCVWCCATAAPPRWMSARKTHRSAVTRQSMRAPAGTSPDAIGPVGVAGREGLRALPPFFFLPPLAAAAASAASASASSVTVPISSNTTVAVAALSFRRTAAAEESTTGGTTASAATTGGSTNVSMAKPTPRVRSSSSVCRRAAVRGVTAGELPRLAELVPLVFARGFGAASPRSTARCISRLVPRSPMPPAPTSSSCCCCCFAAWRSFFDLRFRLPPALASASIASASASCLASDAR